MIHLDTHVVAWLYAGEVERLPPGVRRRLEEEPLAISPIVALELEYLYELGRVRDNAETVLAALGMELGLRQCDLDFGRVVAAARGLAWTRDPFDRLIVGQATARGVELLTKDQVVRDHFPGAVWG